MGCWQASRSSDLYAYVYNDPLDNTDPDGTDECPVNTSTTAASCRDTPQKLPEDTVAAKKNAGENEGSQESKATPPADSVPITMENRGGRDRGQTAKPDGTANPDKYKFDEKTGRWVYKDANGKKIVKPPGFVPPGQRSEANTETEIATPPLGVSTGTATAVGGGLVVLGVGCAVLEPCGAAVGAVLGIGGLATAASQ